jgi:type IV secretory pathway VirB9-like protein
MKTLPILFLTFGLAAGATTTSYAGTTPEPKHVLLPSAPRTVIITETDTPPVIRTGLLQATLIELPAEEKVATVFGGDTVSWVFDGGHVASRFISIKPKVANSTTDVHIVSDHGNEYTLQLREVSADGDPHFDSKVFVTPGDQVGKDKLAAMPVFVPAAELDKAKREAAEAAAKQTNDLKAAQTKAEAYRSQYPSELHFDYAWDRKKADALGLQQVWRDDKFTYLRGHFQETPALYELKDGKGSLINFDFNDGLYTIPKTVLVGYLTIGKQRVEFHRIGTDHTEGSN